MFKNLQYMSTIQALPSYNFVEKNKHSLHTKKAQIHTLKTVPGGV
jgi:hypothetical protein